MAYTRSGSWRFARRYRNPYWSRSRTSRRRASGNTRAARNQRDSATVVINRIATIPVLITPGDTNGYSVINHWDQLRLSNFFPNYAPMYDQMKLDKIRVKVTGNQAGSAQTSNLSPSVVMAFDRNGLDSGQALSSALISTYSSAQLKQWSTGNAFVMYQTIYPSTIMEKGQYIPTQSLVDPATSLEPANPCFDTSDPTLPFKPLSFLAVDIGMTQTSNQTFAFTCEFEYTVTFRGMRKPSLSSSSSDLRPLEVDIYENGVRNYTPEGFDGYSSVQVSTFIDTTFPPRFSQQLTKIYIDINSEGVDIPGAEWQSYLGGDTISLPNNTILVMDFELTDDTHTVVLAANVSGSGTTYTVPISLRNKTGYLVRFLYTFEMNSDSAIYIGTDDGPVFGNSPGYVSSSSVTYLAVRLNKLYAYPDWE